MTCKKVTQGYCSRKFSLCQQKKSCEKCAYANHIPQTHKKLDSNTHSLHTFYIISRVPIYISNNPFQINLDKEKRRCDRNQYKSSFHGHRVIITVT